MKSDASWSYYENPFVGTRQLNGLLVLQAMLGNSDLKDDQNALYTLEKPLEGATRWYVARDLGQIVRPHRRRSIRRAAISTSSSDTPFIRGVSNGKVQFEYRGRHKALLRQHHAGRRPLDLRPRSPR